MAGPSAKASAKAGSSSKKRAKRTKKPATQPTEEKPATQPADEKPVTQPVEEKPAQEKPATQPADEKPVTQPAEEKPVDTGLSAKAAGKRPMTSHPTTQLEPAPAETENEAVVVEHEWNATSTAPDEDVWASSAPTAWDDGQASADWGDGQATANWGDEQATASWGDEQAALEDKEQPAAEEPVQRLTGIQATSLLTINGKLVQPTHPEAIRRVASDYVGGLEVSARVTGGPLQPPRATISFRVRHDEQVQHMAALDFSFQHSDCHISVDRIESADFERLSAELGLDEQPLSPEPELSFTHGWVEEDRLKDKELDSDVHGIQHICDNVIHVTIEIPTSEVVVRFAQYFIKRLKVAHEDYSSLYRTVKDQLASLDDGNGVVKLALFINGDLKVFQDWDCLSQRPAIKPLAEIQGDTPLERLHITTVNSDFTRPDRALAPVYTFTDESHRSTIHFVAMKDEITLQEQKLAAAEKIKFQASMIPIEGSRWIDTPEEQAACGVKPGDQYLQFMLILQYDEEGFSVLPPVDSPVVFHLGLKQTRRRLPAHDPTELEIDDRILSILDALKDAATTADNSARAEDDRQKAQARRIVSHDPEFPVTDEDRREAADDIAENSPDLEDIWRDAFLSNAGNALLGYTGEGMPADIVNAYNDPEERHSHYAQQLAVRLNRQPDESEEQQRQRISLFVRSCKLYTPQDDIPKVGEDFKAVRVPAPPGVVSHDGFFLVNVPRQKNWPKAFHSAPFIKIEPPGLTPGKDKPKLHKLFADVPSFYATFSVKITWTINTKHLVSEAAGLRDMNCRKKVSPGKAWHTWTVNFPPPSEELQRDLCQVFPGLPSKIAEGIFGTDTDEIEQSLKQSNAGKIWTLGCPGSGKTTFAVNVVMAAIEGGTLETAGYRNDDTWTRADNQVITIDQDHESDDGLTYMPDLDDSEDGIDTTPELDDGQQEEQCEPPLEPACIAEVRQTIVIWSAPGHKQIDDAVQRFVDRAVPVAKVYAVDDMLQALLRGKRETPPLLDAGKKRDVLSRKLTDHVNAINNRRVNDKTVHGDDHSLVDIAMAMVDADPGQWTHVVAAREAGRDFMKNATVYKEAGRTLLEAALRTVTVVCGTPYAIRDLAQKNSQFAPTLLVIDEVGFMTEALTISVTALFPQIPAIFVGDVRQFGPIAPTLHQSGNGLIQFQDSFGGQRGTSLAKRIWVNNAFDVILRNNNRAFGDVARYAQDVLYAGEMFVVNTAETPVTRAIRDHIRSYAPEAKVNNLAINLPDAKETAQGTSYTNQAVADCAVSYALQLAHTVRVPRPCDVADTPAGLTSDAQLGEICILSAYLQQVYLIQGIINNLHPMECPPGLITTRTVDSAQGMQASVIILCADRDRRTGHLTAPERILVGLTRAHFLCVVVGNLKPYFEHHSPVQRYLQWMQQRKAVVEVEGWALFCKKCLSHGHLAAQCPGVLCYICGRHNATHAGRYCKHDVFVPMTRDINTPYTPIDSVNRDIFEQSVANPDTSAAVPDAAPDTSAAVPDAAPDTSGADVTAEPWGTDVTPAADAGATMTEPWGTDVTPQSTADADHVRSLFAGPTVRYSASGSYLDGGGSQYWDGEGDSGKTKPKFFYAHSLTSSTITNLHIQNTPVQAVSINGCTDLTVTGMTIDNSAGDTDALGHNTDGFDIGASTGVTITGANVYNQDDCVAVNSGTDITFTGGTCSGGHGLSIGSVGGRSDNTVSSVTFSNSVVKNSVNGIRIKASAGDTGTISGVTYSGITLQSISKYGILIEQNYDGGDLHGDPTTGIPITDLTIKNIAGSGAVSSSGYDVVVVCGSGSCSDWTWSGVTVTGGKTYASCQNVPSVVGGCS